MLVFLIDPTNPLIMYIGTGDRDAGDTYSLGVMKSTDGGLTWNPTGLSFNLTQSARIVGMAMHKDSPHHLVAATQNGILRSLDGGATWTTEAGGTFGCLVQVPGTNKLFAGTSSNGRIWMSTDFGDTWTMLTNGLPTNAGRQPSNPNSSRTKWPHPNELRHTHTRSHTLTRTSPLFQICSSKHPS